MSPPEVWGPAVWTLFHTLIEKLNPDAYPYVIGSMFRMIIRICTVLPCPECSRDASNFLAKINLKDYKTKDEFKNMLYLFHNWVNAKKRKPLFNYANMNKYSNLYLPFVINNFIAKYNTKGNMKLLAESFQRSFVVKDLIAWFKTYSKAFIRPPIVNVPQNNTQPLESVVEEPVIEEPVTEEPVTEEEPTITEEEPTIVEEPNVIEEEQESINENIVSLNILDENHIDESFKIEKNYPEIQEPVIVEEQQVIIQQPKKKRTGKLKKK
jgi:hypothetical protein